MGFKSCIEKFGYCSHISCYLGSAVNAVGDAAYSVGTGVGGAAIAAKDVAGRPGLLELIFGQLL